MDDAEDRVANGDEGTACPAPGSQAPILGIEMPDTSAGLRRVGGRSWPRSSLLGSDVWTPGGAEADQGPGTGVMEARANLPPVGRRRRLRRTRNPCSATAVALTAPVQIAPTRTSLRRRDCPPGDGLRSEQVGLGHSANRAVRMGKQHLAPRIASGIHKGCGEGIRPCRGDER